MRMPPGLPTSGHSDTALIPSITDRLATGRRIVITLMYFWQIGYIRSKSLAGQCSDRRSYLAASTERYALLSRRSDRNLRSNCPGTLLLHTQQFRVRLVIGAMPQYHAAHLCQTAEKEIVISRLDPQATTCIFHLRNTTLAYLAQHPRHDR